jgi:hypothetical protein
LASKNAPASGARAKNFSWETRPSLYIARVSYLTKQEQMVLCLILALVLAGWAVKTYRTAHPPARAAFPSSKT